MNMGPEEKLRQLGLKLPSPPKPAGTYSPAVRVGSLLFVAGQVPSLEGELKFKGKLGKDLSVEQGYQAAKLAALNSLSVAKSVVGSLDMIEAVPKMIGFVNSADDFDQQPKVVNGASELFVELFGEKGRPARTSVGVNSLPSNVSVEVEVTFQIKE